MEADVTLGTGQCWGAQGSQGVQEKHSEIKQASISVGSEKQDSGK